MSDDIQAEEAVREVPPNTPEAIVSANVRRLRKSRRLTQEELAEQATRAGHDLGSMAIWSIENGKRRINVDDLYGLAEVLSVSPQQLLTPESERVDADLFFTITFDGGVTETVAADRVDEGDGDWVTFYLRGERVFLASTRRILGTRISKEAP